MAAIGRASVSPGDDGAKELIRLDIPALPAFVGVARVVVSSVATTVDGIDDDRLEDLRIAVSEACTNAVEASLGDAVDQRVVLRCVLDGDALEVHIEDTARSQLPSEASSGGNGLDEGAERDWGMQLIRALVDDVAFSDASDGGGSSVRLLVRRAQDS